MPKVRKRVLVRFTPDQMQELVADIRAYPKFIRWIQSLKIRDEAQNETIYNCIGDVMVSFKGFREQFSTHVESNTDARTIVARLERGPFKHLKNNWSFREREAGGCVVECMIDYEFRNPILNMLARANTDLAIDKVMSAFLGEAKRRYAK